MTEPDRSQLTI